MTPTQPRGRLSVKLLFWFMLISLVPVGVMGWHLTNTSMVVFKEVSLRNQQNLAQRFSETVSHTLTGYMDVLDETARLGEFAATDSSLQESYLLRVMQLHPAFVELSMVDPSGKERLRIGRFRQEGLKSRDLFQAPPFQSAIQGQPYKGSLERLQGVMPALTLSVPVRQDQALSSSGTVKGVLLGKVSLAVLTNLLGKEIPEKDRRHAAVAAPDGFLVAHSNSQLVFRPDAALPPAVANMLQNSTGDTGGREIPLKDGTIALGAYATVPDVGWIIYVQQPLSTAYRAADEIRRQIGKILFWVITITVLLSLAVSAHITLPIRELTHAADQLSIGQFEDLPELTLTNDEIGDLGQSFFQMSESLRDKTDELLEAKEQLEKFQGTLENRVRARERELKSAQDELVTKERLAAMGSMASVVGHEIRNPLAVINNSIFFIKTKLVKSDKLDDKLGKHVRNIEEEIKQANSIINEILNYSRSRDLKPKVMSINAFLQKTLSTFPFPSHVEVVQDLDRNDPLVSIDDEEMRQAVRNIIGNAIDVMPQAGTLEVRTEVFRNDWVRISLRDTGPGIPPDVLNKMFNPFYTTKARGTGLGLAVVTKALTRHEGRVEVTSQVGKGTLFRLYVPLYRERPGVKTV
jgi:signal transduction histidine kinase